MNVFPHKLPLVSLLSVLISYLIPSNNGFTADIFHRDSPISPFYNASMTRFERAQNMFRRSITRQSSHHLAFSFDIDLKYSKGDYLTKVVFGTPRIEQLLLVDTGSDLTWIQCSCSECFRQDPPIFDPKLSSTFRPIKCGSDQCSIITDDIRSCNERDNTCQYNTRYVDGASTIGDVIADTMSFAFGPRNIPIVSFYDFVFGCGRQNTGGVDGGESGQLGLGRGSESIINQHSKIFAGKFSHCLTRDGSEVPGTLSFGYNAIITGSYSTPLYVRPDSSFYFVMLNGVAIRDQNMEIQTSLDRVGSHVRDYMILDMGTTLSYLQRSIYESVESAMLQLVKRERVQNDFSNLCFRERLKRRKFLLAPTVVLQFDGANLQLPSWKTFIEIEDGIFCFTFKPRDDEFALFGNMHSADIRIGYDLENEIVHFQPTDCTLA